MLLRMQRHPEAQLAFARALPVQQAAVVVQAAPENMNEGAIDRGRPRQRGDVERGAMPQSSPVC